MSDRVCLWLDQLSIGCPWLASSRCRSPEFVKGQFCLRWSLSAHRLMSGNRPGRCRFFGLFEDFAQSVGCGNNCGSV